METVETHVTRVLENLQPLYTNKSPLLRAAIGTAIELRDMDWQSLLAAERARREEAEKLLERVIYIGKYGPRDRAASLDGIITDARAFLAAAQKGEEECGPVES